MRGMLVGAVGVFLVLGFAACSDEESTDPGGGGGSGPCAGIERVCSSSDDCPSLQVCSSCGECEPDPGSGSCETTADCPIGRACRIPEGGTALACVRVVCDNHDDCAEGEACTLPRHACVPGDCVSLGCPDGSYCRAEDSSCVECLSNTHCAGTAKPFCDEARNLCVVCEYDGDCGDGRRCVENECVACADNDDCRAPNPICRDDGRCVSCLSDDDCPTGVACLPAGRCDLGPVAGEPCDPGRACAPGYRCEGDDPGTCFQKCNPYAPTCAEGEVCAFLGDENGDFVMEGNQPAGICGRTDSGSTVCDEARLCKAGLICLPADAATDRCRKPCAPGASPEGVCDPGQICKPLPIGPNGAEIGFCMEPTAWLDECGNDADCGAGMGCVISVEGDEIVPVCAYTPGTGDALDPCDADDDCRSATCLGYDGAMAFCWGACESDADCGGGTCGTYDFTLEGGRRATVSGCHATCENDADCAAYDDFICGIGVNAQKQIFAECMPGDGGAGPGDTCTADDQCALGLCFDDGGTTWAAEDGFCLGPCKVDADCAGNTVCRPAALQVQQTPPIYGVLDLCWGEDCDSDADCPADWACGLEVDPANPTGAIRFSCGPGYGDLLPGAYCGGDNDCTSGVCVGLNTGEQICYGPCAAATDCAAGSYCESQAFTFNTPNGTAVTLPGCLPDW